MSSARAAPRGRAGLVADRREGAGEDAGRANGDRKVHDFAEMAVDLGRLVGGTRRGEHPDHGKSVEVDALRLKPGVANAPDKAFDHPGAGRDDHHALAAGSVDVEILDELVIEDRVLEGHGDGVAGHELDGSVALLGVLDPRDLERADGDLLVRDPQAHVAREVVGREEAPERRGEPGGVTHLALLDQSRREVCADGSLNVAVDDLDRGDVVTVEIEADTSAGSVVA